MKKGSPSCGLYLRIDAGKGLDAHLPKLREAAFVINRSDYERNMHVIEITPGADIEAAAALVEIARMEGLVALVAGLPAQASVLKADGVMLAEGGDVAAARKTLGDDAIIGVHCGADRGAAEAALESGADLVAFGKAGGVTLPPVSLFQWWSTASEVPALALGRVTNDDAGELVRAGATFLDSSDYVWGYEKGIMQAVSNMLYAIDLGGESVRAQ